MKLLFYYGTDTGRLRLAVAELIGRYTAKHGTACNLHRLDLSDAHGSEEFDRVLRYPSFFDDVTFITVRGAFTSKDIAKRTRDLLRDCADVDDIVVLVQASGTKSELSKLSSPLYSHLTGPSATTKTFEGLSGAGLVTWAQSFCGERACTLGAREASLLIERAGTDTTALMTELEKLCAYTGSGAIDASAIRLIVTPIDPAVNVFGLTDALARREKRAILTELSHQLSNGNAPHAVLSLCAFAVRNLLMVGDLAERKEPARSIARTTGLHPFVVTKSLTALIHFTLPDLKRAHAWLATADRETKTGRWDATDALFDFVLSIV